jgi:hypothetical protein
MFSKPYAELTNLNTALFHLLIVGPSEEILFRFFLPLAIIYFTGVHYIFAGIMAAIGFGFAHWWAYKQNISFIMIALISGIIQTFTVWFFSRDDDNEEWKVPMDAIAFYSISVIVFLFSMINYLYSNAIENVLVYLIYGVTGIMAVVLGYFLINFLNEREVDGLDFSPGLLAAILSHGLYNVVVSMSPGLIIPLAVIGWVSLGIVHYLKGRGDSD